MFDPQRITGMSAHPRAKQNLFLLDVLGDGVGDDRPRPMKRAEAQGAPEASP